MRHLYWLLFGVVCVAFVNVEEAKARQAITESPKLLAYVSNLDGNSVEMLNLNSGLFLGHLIDPGSDSLSNPHRMIIGPDGFLYLGTGPASSEVRRYHPITGAYIDTFVSNGSGGLFEAAGVQFGPDGNLYVSSKWTTDIKRYSHVDGTYLGSFISGNGLNTPTYFEFRSDGMVYVSSSGVTSGVAEIKRFNSKTGAFIDNFVTANSGGLNEAEGFTFGPDGNLYVASWGSDEVIRYNGRTGVYIDTFIKAGSGGLHGPGDIVFAQDGYLYVTAQNGTLLKRYDRRTGTFIADIDPGGQAHLMHPNGLLIMPAPPGTLDHVTLRQNPVSAGAGTEGYIFLSKPTATPMRIQVGTDNSAVATVLGGTLTIPAGGTRGTFRVAANKVKANSSCQLFISGDAGGMKQAITATLNIGAVYLNALSVSPDHITAGSACKGTVKLTEAAVAPVLVRLGIKGTNAASVKFEDSNGNAITSVTIPTGRSSADFMVNTVGVQKSVSAIVYASYGSASCSASLIVFPNGALSSVVITPNPVSAGSVATGTVTLSSPAVSDVVVSINTNNTNVATISGSPCTIPVGSTQGTFTIITKRVKASSSCRITASDNASGALQNTQTTLTVNP